MTNSSFFFNFDTKQVINPLELVTSFYVSPYMAEGARTLKIQERLKAIETADSPFMANVHSMFVNGVPVIVFPISLLNWTNVKVSMPAHDHDKIIVKSGRMTVYVKLFAEDPSTVRIDSVICS